MPKKTLQNTPQKKQKKCISIYLKKKALIHPKGLNTFPSITNRHMHAKQIFCHPRTTEGRETKKNL